MTTVIDKRGAAKVEEKPLSEQLKSQSQQPKEASVSIGDLTRMCNDAASKMSKHNPNRLLLLNCAYAMQQLVRRVMDLEKRLNPTSVQ